LRPSLTSHLRSEFAFVTLSLYSISYGMYTIGYSCKSLGRYNRVIMSVKKLEAYAETHRILAASLAEIGFTWPGTIQARKLKCGKAQCTCQTDPKNLHGPYYYWTTKVRGKTVSKMLTENEVRTLEVWIQNRRKLEKTLKQMKNLSQKTAAMLFKNKALSQKLLKS
jgi:hypothetical protein